MIPYKFHSDTKYPSLFLLAEHVFEEVLRVLQWWGKVWR